MEQLSKEQRDKALKLTLSITSEMLFTGLMAFNKFIKNPYNQIKTYKLKPRIKKPRKAYRKLKK
jgi:hypothetical protein